MRTLHDVQESALTYQAVEIADRVASEFLVVKIHPEPNPRTAVVDVEGAGFRVPWNNKEHEEGPRELDPFRDCRVLSHIEQPSDCSIYGAADLFPCMPEIDDWDYVHFPKHGH